VDRRELLERLTTRRYPRASRYDPAWLIENMMGPNAAWLAEALTDVMPLRPGDHVLDLGCGRAVSSIFLAKEFQVEVDAVDLWIDPLENERRIAYAGLSTLVTVRLGDGTSLEAPPNAFDAMLSIDAYHYFGTQPGVLTRLTSVLRPGGRIGIVVPGVGHDDGWPKHLEPWWQEGFDTFHSPAWWRRLWEAEGVVRVDLADMIPQGAEDWLRWTETVDAWTAASGGEPYRLEAEMLRADHDNVLGFTRVVATKL
jgi:SAM-dependent methyltransferase